jgi:hypothetical protein
VLDESIAHRELSGMSKGGVYCGMIACQGYDAEKTLSASQVKKRNVYPKASNDDELRYEDII